jgi:hypothetical protein
MGDPLGLLDLGPLDCERSGVGYGGTGLAAVRTGLVGQHAGLLEGPAIHVEPRSVVAECPLRDDLGPPGSKAAEFLGREAGAAWLVLPCGCVDGGSGISYPPSKHRQTRDKP